MANRDSVFWRPSARPVQIEKGEAAHPPVGAELVRLMGENVAEAHKMFDAAVAKIRAMLATGDVTEVGAGRNATLASQTPAGRLAMSDLARARAELHGWQTQLVQAERDHGGPVAPAPAVVVQDRRLPIERDDE